MASVSFCCPVCKTDNLTIDRKQLVVHGLSMNLENGKRFLKKGGKYVRALCAPHLDVKEQSEADGFIDPPQGLRFSYKGPREKVQSIDWNKVREEMKKKR